MRNIRIIALSAVVLGTVVIATAFTQGSGDSKETEILSVEEVVNKQSINLFVTHGHCSTPFSGAVNDLEIVTNVRKDAGNPLENMRISFAIDPQTFFVCASEDITKRIKRPGLFLNNENEKMVFKSTEVYTMGIDWYQVNGKLSIKGVEKDVKFFVSGIRNPDDAMAKSIVLEGQLDLTDWGIDYDLIVHGESNDEVPSKWMHLNMKVDLP